MKKITTTFFLLLTLLNLSSCKGKKEVLNIGVIFPLSGSTSYLLPTKKGLDLALDEIRANNFFSDKEIKLYYVDSASDIKTATEVMRNLEEQIHPELYISLTSNISIALSNEAETYKVPLMCLVTSSPNVTKNNKYTFSFYQTAREEVKAVLPVVIDTNFKNIGILYQDEIYGQSVLTESIRQMKDYNIEIKAFPFSMLEPNIDNYTEELKTKESLFIVGYKNNAVAVLKQLREINYKGVILGSSTFSVKDIVTLDQANGLYVSAPVIYNSNYLPVSNLRIKYEEVYKEPIQHFAAVGYDVLFLLTELLKNEEDITRATVLSKLSSGFIYPSLYGAIEKTRDERTISIPLQSAIIEDKKLIFLVY